MLLLSVRSGAAMSMPGMMDTVLNLGLNDKSVEILAKLTKNERFIKCIMRTNDNFANGISTLSAPTHEALSATLYI